jgi:ketosteroid isomerase-like protein
VALIWQTDTGSAVLADVFHVVELRDGKISGMRVFLDRSEALAAVGL